MHLRERLIVWQEWCFFLSILLLPIQNNHWFSSLGFLFGNNVEKWSLFPLLIGMALGCITQWRYRDFTLYSHIFFNFAGIFYVFSFTSLLWGIYIFPWWDADIFGETKFLAKILTVTTVQEFSIQKEMIRKIWFFARSFRDLLTSFIYTFGVTYWILCLFYNRCEKAMALTGKAIIYSLMIMLPYACIEFFYLEGSTWAGEILSTINPFLYDVTSVHNWWPPVLWKGQMRNLFAEPSFFGAWLSIIIPFLWYKTIYHSQKLFIGTIISFLCYFMVFLTVARTALCLAIGEIILLIIISIWSWNKKIIVKTFIICLCFICAFISNIDLKIYKKNLLKPKNTQTIHQVVQKTESYLNTNALNVVKPKARSNQARYSNMAAFLKIGIDHPIIGVGSTLVKAYLPFYFSSEAFQNSEVKNWINMQNQKGFLSSSIPSLSEYPVRFAEKGLLGLLIFLIPFGIAIYYLSKKLYITHHRDNVSLPMCLWIALAGGCMLGFSMSLNLFSFWILFGVVFTCALSKQGQE